MTDEPICDGDAVASNALAHITEDGRCYLVREYLLRTADFAASSEYALGRTEPGSPIEGHG